ncbi:MAG: cysteine synthase [Alphaproteobacteria bacterium]
MARSSAASDAKPDDKKGSTPASRRAPSRGRIYNDIYETIGGTPLVRASKFIARHGLEADILAKLEYFNPMASIKDRAALAIIEAAEREGRIVPGKTTIIEATSGNMSMSLAFIALSKGYKLVLVMPESVSLERRKILIFHGAEVVLTAAENGMKGSAEIAKSLLKQRANSWMPDQFTNLNAIKAHAETTAEEIWDDTGGKADILVAGVGTAATIIGMAQTLKQKNPAFEVFAVEPAESPVLSGGEPGQHKIQGIGAGFKPPLLEKAGSVINGIIQVPSKDAIEMARQVTQLEGITCGLSTGATFAAALEVARLPTSKGKTIIVMAASPAERYVASELFDKIES